MTRPAALHGYTFANYLALEDGSNVKHEYLNGEIYAMAGGTPEHAAVSAAVVVSLGGQLGESRCRVYTSDLRVRVLATGLATYPDVTVVCGPLERDPDSPNTAINPKLLVEVLSEGTENYDRGEKLANYRQIPSLDAVVLVATRERRFEVHRRQDDGSWTTSVHGPGSVASLPEIGCQLAVDAIYQVLREIG